MKLYVAAHLKDMNRKVVYQLMEKEDLLSRADISRQTGISAPTVLKITSYLIEKGILLESGEGNSILGRKPVLLRFNPDAAYTIGVDYRGDEALIGIVNLRGKVKHIAREKINYDVKDFFSNGLSKNINKLIESSKVEPSKILAAGIGIPGVIDSENNAIHFAPLIGLNEKEDLHSEIEKLSMDLGMAVLLENDVNAAAVGEFVSRKNETYGNMVYISAGKGVGAGIIVDGKLHKGSRFSAGEVGYMVFDRNFNTSKTKGGWLEGQINYDSLLEELGVCGEEHICSADPQILENAVDRIASYIGLCIANISSVLDIGVFVVGGIFAEVFGDRFFEDLRKYTARLCLNETNIERQLCSHPTLVGMASIARNSVIDSLLAE